MPSRVFGWGLRRRQVTCYNGSTGEGSRPEPTPQGGTNVGYRSTTPAVLNHLQQNVDTNLTVAEIASATGLNTGQVQASMRSLIARGTLPIETLVPSQMWRMNVNGTVVPVQAVIARKARAASAVDDLYEPVGNTSAGDRIVKGNNTGTLYRLQAL